MPINNSFLGTGWGFPVSFQKPGCRMRMVSHEDDICESLHILLSTRPGERVMRPNYGCNLDILLFEPINTSMLTYVKDLIEKAILYNETRIELKNIHINVDRQYEGILQIELDYVIRATNSRYNYVFPFYRQEAEALISIV